MASDDAKPSIVAITETARSIFVRSMSNPQVGDVRAELESNDKEMLYTAKQSIKAATIFETAALRAMVERDEEEG